MPASVVEKLRVAPVPLTDDAEVAVRVGAVVSSVVNRTVETAEILPALSLTTTYAL